jgi:NADH-quinone oxidoreductase subunit G
MPADKNVSWDVAVAEAAIRLKESAAVGRAGAILSPRLPAETLFALKQLFETLGPVRVGVHRIVRGEDDGLLIRADKGANGKGAEWILGQGAEAGSVLEAVARGEIDTLFVTGDALDPDDTPAVGESVRSAVKQLIYMGPFRDATAMQATISLPGVAWAEEDGTFVNFEGRVQRVKRCHTARGEGRPGWRAAADLMIAAGHDDPGWLSAADVLAALARQVKQFEGLSEERIGLLGVARDTAATAGN